MEHTHTIKLSTGKEITLSDEEYKEIKASLGEAYYVAYMPTFTPVYPTYIEPWITTTVSA